MFPLGERGRGVSTQRTRPSADRDGVRPLSRCQLPRFRMAGSSPRHACARVEGPMSGLNAESHSARPPTFSLPPKSCGSPTAWRCGLDRPKSTSSACEPRRSQVRDLGTGRRGPRCCHCAGPLQGGGARPLRDCAPLPVGMSVRDVVCAPGTRALHPGRTPAAVLQGHRRHEPRAADGVPPRHEGSRNPAGAVTGGHAAGQGRGVRARFREEGHP